MITKIAMLSPIVHTQSSLAKIGKLESPKRSTQNNNPTPNIAKPEKQRASKEKSLARNESVDKIKVARKPSATKPKSLRTSIESKPKAAEKEIENEQFSIDEPKNIVTLDKPKTSNQSEHHKSESLPPGDEDGYSDDFD